VASTHGQAGQHDHGAPAYHCRADDQGSRLDLRSAAAVLAIAHGIILCSEPDHYCDWPDGHGNHPFWVIGYRSRSVHHARVAVSEGGESWLVIPTSAIMGIGDLQTAALMSTCCSKSSLPCANDRAAAAQRRDRLAG
jgi:hypothetical protein